MKKIVSMTAEKIFETQQKRLTEAITQHRNALLHRRDAILADVNERKKWFDQIDSVEKLLQQMDMPLLHEQISKEGKEIEQAKFDKFLESLGIDKTAEPLKVNETRQKLEKLWSVEKAQFDISAKSGEKFKEFLKKKLDESIAEKVKGNIGLEFSHIVSSPDNAIQFFAETDVASDLKEKEKAIKQLNEYINELKDELSTKPRTVNKKERKVNIQRLKRLIIGMVDLFQEPEIQKQFKKDSLKKLKPDQLIKSVTDVFNSVYSLDHPEKVNEKKVDLIAKHKHIIQSTLELNHLLNQLDFALNTPEHAKDFPNKKAEIKHYQDEIKALVETFPDDDIQKIISKQKLFKQKPQQWIQNLRPLFNWQYCDIFAQDDQHKLTNIDILLKAFAISKNIDMESPDAFTQFSAKVKSQKEAYDVLIKDTKKQQEDSKTMAKLKRDFWQTADFVMDASDKEFLEKFRSIPDSKKLEDLEKRKKAYAKMEKKVQQVLHLFKELRDLHEQKKRLDEQDRSIPPEEGNEERKAWTARKKDYDEKRVKAENALYALYKEGVADFIEARAKKAEIDEALGIEKPKAKTRTDAKRIQEEVAGVTEALEKAQQEEAKLKKHLDQLHEKRNRQGNVPPVGSDKDPKVVAWNLTGRDIQITTQNIANIEHHIADLKLQQENLNKQKKELEIGSVRAPEEVAKEKLEKKSKKDAAFKDFQKYTKEIEKREKEIAQLPRGFTAQQRKSQLELEIALFEDQKAQIKQKFPHIEAHITKEETKTEASKKAKKQSTLLLKLEQKHLQDQLDQYLGLKSAEEESGATDETKPLMDLAFLTEAKVKDGVAENPFYFQFQDEDPAVLKSALSGFNDRLKDLTDVDKKSACVKQMVVGAFLMKHAQIQNPENIQLLRGELFLDERSQQYAAKLKKLEKVEWPSFESKDDFDQVLKALREIDPNTDFYLLQFILKKFKLSDAQKKNPTDVLWKMAKASIAGFEKDYRKAFGHKFKEFFEERLKWKPDRMSLEAMALDQAQAQDESQKVLNISYLVKRISEETDPVKLERLVRLAAIPEDVKKSLVEHLKQYNEAVKDSESLLKDAPDAFDRLGALVQSIFV